MKEIKENPFEVEAKILLEGIKDHGALIFKSALDAKTIQDFMTSLLNKSSRLSDSPSKFIQENPISFYRKLNIGSYGEFGEYPRFFRTTYCPFWLPELSFSESVFRPIILLRNHLAGVPPDFAYTEDFKNNLWSACRIQQYFPGGSFFSEHQDVVIHDISQQRKLQTIQLVALLTSKGEDFLEGGATVRDANNNLMDIEAVAKAGDIIAYDGASLHGVSPVDSKKVLDLRVNAGRLVALASTYKIKIA